MGWVISLIHEQFWVVSIESGYWFLKMMVKPQKIPNYKCMIILLAVAGVSGYPWKSYLIIPKSLQTSGSIQLGWDWIFTHGEFWVGLIRQKGVLIIKKGRNSKSCQKLHDYSISFLFYEQLSKYRRSSPTRMMICYNM